jgi:hypothetical protein
LGGGFNSACTQNTDCAPAFGCIGGTCKRWCVDGHGICTNAPENYVLTIYSACVTNSPSLPSSLKYYDGVTVYPTDGTYYIPLGYCQ